MSSVWTLTPCPQCGRQSTADHQATCTSGPTPLRPAPWMGAIVVEVDHPIVSPNRLMNEHWHGRARRRRSESAATARALACFRPPPLPGPGEAPIEVTFTRIGPRLLDDDGLSYSFKSPRDQLSTFLGCGDSPKDPVRWSYRQEVRREARIVRGKKGFRVWFRIEIRCLTSASR